MSVDLFLDATLALLLAVVAWRVAVTQHLPTAVILFIAFGLLLAVAWARLGAPDVALVEAAVGAGLTGALLMAALGWIGPEEPPGPRLTLRSRAALGVLLALVFVGLIAAVLSLPGAAEGLRVDVRVALPASGVSHPTTAVLLNFRGYDTLLEIAVLLVAVLGVHVSRAELRGPTAAADDDDDDDGTLLAVLVRLLVPAVVVVGGLLLWRGSHAPGGAFQAGAVVAAGGILWVVSRRASPPLSSWAVRAALVLGLSVFLLVAIVPLGLGQALLQYPTDHAGALVLAIEAALTVSVAVMLTLFFPPPRAANRQVQR